MCGVVITIRPVATNARRARRYTGPRSSDGVGGRNFGERLAMQAIFHSGGASQEAEKLIPRSTPRRQLWWLALKPSSENRRHCQRNCAVRSTSCGRAPNDPLHIFAVAKLSLGHLLGAVEQRATHFCNSRLKYRPDGVSSIEKDKIQSSLVWGN
jgi:hypothetical protein